MKLNEARRLQKEIQSKVLLKFFGFSVVFGVLSLLLVHYSGLTERIPTLYILPLIAIFFVGRKTHIGKMFSPKEFIGEVIDIDIYGVTSQRVKGERSYIRKYGLEAEIIICNKNGKKFTKTLPNGDITERLCLGDQIAFLRFIEEPIVIKGNYLK